MTESAPESTPKATWPTSAKVTVCVLAAITAIAVTFAAVNSGDEGASSSSLPGTSASATDDSSAVVVDEETTESEPQGEDDAQEPHQFEESVSLRGSGTTVSVTPSQFFTSLQPDPYGFVEDNQKLVGVMLEVKNDGDKVFEANPGADVLLIDSESGSWESDFEIPANGSACTPDFDLASLPQGSERRGCLTFTLPKDVTPASVQVQLDSGTSPDIAVWEIPAE